MLVSRSIRRGLGVLALVCATTSLAYADPTPAERETARTLLLSGREKRKKGQNKEALADFEKAHAIMHVPTTGLDLGKTQQALGLLVEARATFLESARYPVQPNEPVAFKNARDEAKTLAEQIAPKLATLTVTVRDGAKVKIDDSEISASSVNTPLKVNPGHHQVVASNSADQKSAQVDLGEGETKSLELQLAPEPAPKPVAPAQQTTTTEPAPKPTHTETKLSPLVYAGGAVAGVGVVVGSITGLMAFGAKSDVTPNCGPSKTQCPPSTWSKIDSGETLGTISTIAFIVAGVGAGVLVYGLLTPTKVETASTGPRVTGASPFGVTGVF